MGGGNAANTAAALALLSGSKAFGMPPPGAGIGGGRGYGDDGDDVLGGEDESGNSRDAPPAPVRVCLLTKLGDDPVRDALCDELRGAGVDLTSPLFMSESESTSPVTTVIVTEAGAGAGASTRTCLHTPGTCGVLLSGDVPRSADDLDALFWDGDVAILHSDTRHTGAALELAKEARRRGVPVSVDVERHRGEAMDELIDLSSLVFINEGQIGPYLERESLKRGNGCNHATSATPDLLCSHGEHMECYGQAVALCHCLNGWHEQSDVEKEIIVTR